MWLQQIHDLEDDFEDSGCCTWDAIDELRYMACMVDFIYISGGKKHLVLLLSRATKVIVAKSPLQIKVNDSIRGENPWYDLIEFSNRDIHMTIVNIALIKRIRCIDTNSLSHDLPSGDNDYRYTKIY